MVVGMASECSFNMFSYRLRKAAGWYVPDDDNSVPVVARRLAAPSLVWLNDRWLLSVGIDVAQCDVRAAFSKWLLDNYAYIVPGDEEKDCAADDTRVFFADRYGETGASAHGGSGRVASAGPLQVKGIGKTPLTGTESTWYYTHGCVWLEEAIREAIYSEIFALEAPAGVIPIVAVVDTGVFGRTASGDEGERRALLIRPIFKRLSHLQRALKFLPHNDTRTSQLKDVRRTKQFVNAFIRSCKVGDLAASLSDLSSKLADQVAFCQVNRLIHGGFFSSNLTIKGELVDFGGARSLPSWRKLEYSLNKPCFGDELDTLVAVLRSVAFYLNRYGGLGGVDGLIMVFIRNYRSSLRRQILRINGLASNEIPKEVKIAVIDMFNSVFSSQQRSFDSFVTGDPARIEVRAKDLSDADTSRRVSREVISKLYPEAWAHWCAGAAPRRVLYREVLQGMLSNIIGASITDNRRDWSFVNDFMRTVLTYGIRSLLVVPKSTVRGQFTDGVTVVIVYAYLSGGGLFGMIRSPVLDGYACVLGKKIKLDRIRGAILRGGDTSLEALVPCEEIVDGGLLLEVGHDRFHLTSIYWYEQI